MDSWTHFISGLSAFEQGDRVRGAANWERALELSPNDASTLRLVGGNLAYALGTERAQEGVELYERAMRLNPYMPAWMTWTLGWAQYFAGQYEQAIETFHKSGETDVDTHVYLSLAYAQLGRKAEAGREVSQVLRQKPDFTAKGWLDRYHGAASSETLFLDGARKAGLPDRPAGAVELRPIPRPRAQRPLSVRQRSFDTRERGRWQLHRRHDCASVSCAGTRFPGSRFRHSPFGQRGHARQGLKVPPCRRRRAGELGQASNDPGFLPVSIWLKVSRRDAGAGPARARALGPQRCWRQTQNGTSPAIRRWVSSSSCYIVLAGRDARLGLADLHGIGGIFGLAHQRLVVGSAQQHRVAVLGQRPNDLHRYTLPLGSTTRTRISAASWSIRYFARQSPWRSRNASEFASDPLDVAVRRERLLSDRRQAADQSCPPFRADLAEPPLAARVNTSRVPIFAVDRAHRMCQDLRDGLSSSLGRQRSCRLFPGGRERPVGHERLAIGRSMSCP